MGIIRVAKNNNYVVMNRTALNDKRLSWKAKGIMAYLLSMPDDWVFYMEELQSHSTDGKASFQSGFKELKDCGYVERRPVREGQRIKEWETIVHEIPVNPLQPDFQEVGFQEVENQQLLSTDINQVLNKPNTKNTNISTSSISSISKYYAERIEPLTRSQEQQLKKWTTKIDDAVIYKAIEKIEEHCPDNPFAYFVSLLRNWSDKGYRLYDIIELDEAYKKSKQGLLVDNEQPGYQRHIEDRGHFKGIPTLDF